MTDDLRLGATVEFRRHPFAPLRPGLVIGIYRRRFLLLRWTQVAVMDQQSRRRSLILPAWLIVVACPWTDPRNKLSIFENDPGKLE